MRASRGNTHYLDDLFLARAELLAGNRQQARRHFARLLDSAARYNARGRLDFELRLSSELKHGDVVLLSQPAPERGPERREPAPRPESPPTERERAPVSALDSIIGKSGVVRALKENIARFAPLDAPVLVTGETGTGKELAALALHEESPRGREPFLTVNCGSITDTLLESELFGHERGAFTGAEKANKGIFEEAGRGTVFLDEIGSIS
ncbi:MAG: sigma-54 factor interaction domain-containing protein, partial [Planctomycetes bacterium]|nr:sigma-54 factor interaction domain-containing protein [Planctomycetota bacterium]